VVPADFQHGASRNLGIQACKAEHVLLLVQDALPQGSGFLAAVLRPLSDHRVAAVTCRQMPAARARASVRWRVERARTFTSERKVLRLEPGLSLSALPAEEARALCWLDHVAACVRRSVWQQLPIPEKPFAEDLAWARQLLEAGHTLVHEPTAIVAHAHDRAWPYTLKRRYLEDRSVQDLFGRNTSLLGCPAARAAFTLPQLARSAPWFLANSSSPVDATSELAAATVDLIAGEAGASLARADAALGRPWRFLGQV
jgi:rhamnosyltransferase